MDERWRALVRANFKLLGVGAVGLVLVLAGLRWWMEQQSRVEVEIIKSDQEKEAVSIWVDVGGAVERAGVYELSAEARVKDALLAAGGLSSEADRSFTSRYINLAQKVADGVKIYIPREGETVDGAGSSNGLVMGGATAGSVNINTASQKELERLWGIGVSRAEAIVGGRPYASGEELLTRKILPGNVYERIKGEISW